MGYVKIMVSMATHSGFENGGEDNFISCVAYFDQGKLQLLMNLHNPRFSPEQDEQIKH